MKRIYHILTILLAFLLIAGCTSMEETPDTFAGKYKTRIVLKSTQQVSRAGSADDQIRRIDILVFRESKLEKYMGDITSFSQTSDGKDYVEVGLGEEGVRTLYIIANNDNDALAASLTEGVTTLDEVLSLQTGELKEMANPPLVMYGILENIKFSSAYSQVECGLSRVVARIDVLSKAANFTMTSASLIRAKASSSIFPGGGDRESKLTDFEAVTADGNTVTLYTYENAGMTLEEATAVEIIGHAKTGETTTAPLKYTVELKRDGKYIPLDRNFRYTINVNSIDENDISALITVRPWILGDDITGEIEGNLPEYELTILPQDGAFSPAESTLTLVSASGAFTLDTKANAECGVESSEAWIKITETTTRAAAIEGLFNLEFSENTGNAPRTATLTIYNKLDREAARRITVTQDAPEQGDKYMVVVVAGQSNAVGYDRSGYNASLDAPDSRAFQLSYRKGPASGQNLSIIPLTYNADNIDSGAKKGIHLPLAKELLKYTPAGYKILVIPVAYTSTTFGIFPYDRPFGTFNTTTLAPDVMNTALRWGKGSAYAQTIVERTKYVMEKFPASKFIGIVWCQGENDKTNSDEHYPAFTSFAEDVLDQLKGLDSKTAYGTVDKRLWFTYTPCIYWVDWFSGASDGDATGVFGGYKYWNPNNFIHVPVTNAHTNPTDKYHYGQNAFSTLVAPLVAKRMNDNGALMNGVVGVTDHFADKTTPADAARLGGSMSDDDITASIQLFMPFRNSMTEKLAGSASISSNTLSLTDAQGLKDISGNPRSSKALKLFSGGRIKFARVPSVSSWSVSFLAKRSGTNTNDIQPIITNGTGANSPFIGFKKYFSTAGVARNAEFLVEPITTTVKNNALPGLFMSAGNVRDLNDWIHYVVTFDNATKLTTVYMNGELVGQATIRTTTTTSLSSLTIGSPSSSMPSADVEMIDFGLWSKVLQPSTVKKLFLMSYYDYTK